MRKGGGRALEEAYLGQWPVDIALVVFRGTCIFDDENVDGRKSRRTES